MNAMEKEITVKIEKLASNAQGIARYEGAVIFVDDEVCPDDECRVEIVKKHKSYYIAKVKKIINSSPYRVKPFCPMHKVCGACQLQHIDYKKQLVIKRQIVEDVMRGLEVEVKEVEPSPQIKEFRHKIQYPIRQTSVSKRLLAGYFKPKSHDLVNIKYCPIQPKICDEIIEFIRENASKYCVDGYNEKTHKGLLRHVVIRSSVLENRQLVVLVVNKENETKDIRTFAEVLFENFESVVGVSLNFNPQKTNLIMSNDTKSVIGKDYIKEKLCDTVFKIGANTFFQVNPESANNIFNYVKNYISDNFDEPVLLDAYAGISAFGLSLSSVAKSVVTVEENVESVKLAKTLKKENNIENIYIYNSDCSEFFEKELEEHKKGYDVTILDPPRKGCTPESLDYALKLTKSKIVYVSCNPATLARDLKYLKEKGAEILSLKPFDMFCHTTHIETVAIIDVENV